jgi:hypothetical protein
MQYIHAVNCYVILKSMVLTVLYYPHSHPFLPRSIPCSETTPYKTPLTGGTVGGLLGVTSRWSLFDLDNLQMHF